MSHTIGGPLPPDRDADVPPPPSEVVPPAVRESPAPNETPAQSIVPRTRTGVAWWALGFSMLLLILVLIFVLQNLSPASTRFFGIKWTIPLGLDLLLAALLGGVIAFLLGAARMLQLRRVARHYARSRRSD
ncbi:MAG: lipopolysaccharide assembly protein LapA domain-containing protein [Candidatus Dormibacteria bacterium]